MEAQVETHKKTYEREQQKLRTAQKKGYIFNNKFQNTTCTVLYCIVLYCSWVPAASAPGCTAAEGLLYKPWFFSRSYLNRQVSPPETLVVKGGTTWARNGR